MSVSQSRGHAQVPVLIRWGSAPLAVALAFFGNEAIPRGMFTAPFFIAAVMIVAHLGGPGPALLAFLLAGAILDYFYLAPIHTWAIDRDLLPSLTQFVVPSLLGCWFIERRKQAEWLLALESELGKRLQGELTVDEIGDRVLDFIAPTLGAPMAVFYSVDLDGSAARRSTFAFDARAAPERFSSGQGLVGQAVRSRSVRLVNVPQDYTPVRSGVGRRRPTQLLLVPAVEAEHAHALLEFALFGSVDRTTLELMERIREPIAIAVRSSTYRTQLQDLLEQTRSQAEELKNHEEELRAANEELEERGNAMAMTQRLLEEQQVELEQTNQALRDQAALLAQQNEAIARANELARARSAEAERANLAKSEFLANMSHELRTPLNSSLILAKLLAEDRDGTLSEEQVRFAETIHSAGNELLGMIDGILDLSKIEAGKLDLRLEELDVSRLVADLQRMFEHVAVERRLHFEIRIDAQVPSTLRTDSQRLAQILKNLLSNAFKFTDKGQVSLSVSATASHTSFAVRDTGIGIAEEKWTEIFEAFKQVAGTSKSGSGGTGLGLTISRDLARLLGGELKVSSVLDQGSTFTLELPVLAAGAEPGAAPALPDVIAVPAPGARDARSPERRCILIIEDDARFARIVGDLAAELEFDCRIVATAEEALSAATAQPPDGIVLDMNLPDHSGLSVLDRLKRDARTRHVPVHVISVADYKRTALEMGAVGYALKPIERQQIKAALHKLQAQFTQSMRRLLVVEDDLAQREAIAQLLGGERVEIVAVGTVREALEELRRGSLDCVVTDLSLPDGSGYDLLRTMAEDEAYSFPSVVVYTGRSLNAEQEQRLRQYSSSIIVKGARSPERLLDEVTLFLHQVESHLPPERQRMLRKARRREAFFEDRTVLIVEDDVRNVFALTSLLEPKGMKVTIARNGREALEALERGPDPDVVLMDIMMPEMDGMQAMQAIRKDGRWPKLPIIALTAKAMKDDQARCLQAGASDYIPKPLDTDMLLSLLRVWIPK